MRLVKLALISIVVFFLLFTIMGSLFPSEVVVSRAIQINASPDSIGRYIADYNQWNEWMQGAKTSDLKVVSKDSGKAFFGTIIITLKEHKDYTWTHEWKGRSNTQVSTFRIIPSNGISTVAWKFEEHLRWYPWEKLGSIMSDKILGTSMEQSLDNLKLTVEKR